MNKLIKPFLLEKSNLKRITFVGTKEYPIINKKSLLLQHVCSLRRKSNPYRTYAQLYGDTGMFFKCQEVQCKDCFYKAKNYLNVLKYRKKLLNE